MKILFIYPPQQDYRGGFVPSYIQQEHAFLYPPLGLLYLASNLDRSKHEIRIIDSALMKLSVSECAELVRDFEPDILGMTVLTDMLYPVKKIAEGAKILSRKTRIVLGGPHVNIYPYETMAFPEVDFCLQHFAESSFNELLKAIENDSGYENVPGLFYKNKNQICKSQVLVNDKIDLDSIKIPDRRMLDYKKYFTVVDNRIITTAITSRGCPSQCTFCDIFQKKYLCRSPENVIEEIKDIVKLGIKAIHFYDDNFNMTKDRVMKFCDLLLKENIRIEWAFRGRVTPIDDEMAKMLYASGCRRVQLGIESSDPETLRMIKKNIKMDDVKRAITIYRKHKILTLGYFIVGFPHEGFEDCVKSVDKAVRLGFNYIQFSTLIPYPNTEIYRELLKTGAKDHWLEFARDPKDNYLIPTMHPSIDTNRLNKIVHQAYKKFYFSPNFIIKEISRMNNPKVLMLKAKAAFKIFATKHY